MNIQDININGIKPIFITEHDDYIGYTLPFLDLIGFKRKKIEELNKIFPYTLDVDVKIDIE